MVVNDTLDGNIPNIPNIDISGIFAEVSTFLWWCFGTIVVVSIILYIINLMKYENKIILFRQTASSSKLIIIEDKFKYYKEKITGIKKIRLLKLNSILWFNGANFQIPPGNVIHSTVNGKEFVQGILISGDEILYVSQDININNLKIPSIKDFLDAQNPQKEHEKALEKWKKEFGKINLQPYGSTERAMIIAENERRELRKQKTIGEMLMIAMPYMFTIIILVLVLIYYGDITAPSQAIANTNAEISKEQLKITQQQSDLLRQINTVYSTMTGKALPEGATPAQTPQQIPGK